MNDTEAILAVEKEWTRAHLQGDTETIARLMDEDYLKIETDGSVSDRAATLEKFTPETRYWEHAQGDEYIVRVYGDTAVVIGRWTARGTNNGEHFDYAARFISVYVRRAEGWKMVSETSVELKGQE